MTITYGNMRRLSFLCMLFLFTSTLSFSQSIGFTKKDFSLQSLVNLTADTIIDKPVVKNFKMRKNPWVAVGLSAVLPGAGQFYNKSYWKIPVIGAVGGYFVYVIIKNNNRYIDFRDQYAASQTTETPAGDDALKNLREFYRDQRDRFYVYSGILYLINLIDAYVDAHLYDFDVSETVKFGVGRGSKLLEMKVNF